MNTPPPEYERPKVEQATIALREGASLEEMRRQAAAERARRRRLMEMTLADVKDYFPGE